ncbi:MAG: prephenate dehydrogenase/arogenate dehydrogenase family protein [Deltaproteobacteria bacterium]|nr:prephenate dehydrogenase/arogenate dehydrogenase family protein [Deltaproteobacteria bacterium]
MSTTPPRGIDPELSLLRGDLREVDDAIVALLARRQELARKIGEVKLRKELPIKAPAVEQDFIGHVRARAAELGLSAELCEETARLLIRYSCREQEEGQRVERGKASAGRNVLVVGGLGLMGQWTARFMASSGHTVTLVDARSAESEFAIATDLNEAAVAADVIVLCTPISATARVIDDVRRSKTRALVFDICSLKSPLIEAIERARSEGLRITSAHPMFGPSAHYLAGRNILLCDAGDASACDEATLLFKSSAATLMRIPILRHDELMRQVLGLSHLTSLIFADTLTRSGLGLSELMRAGSTSFLAQAAVSGEVVRENRGLYYEIQAENVATPRLLQQLRESIEAYATSIASRDRAAFESLMKRSCEYFAGPASAPTE